MEIVELVIAALSGATALKMTELFFLRKPKQKNEFDGKLIKDLYDRIDRGDDEIEMVKRERDAAKADYERAQRAGGMR